MSKKVGIITYHHAINYGANLQGFALWQTVNQQGYDVEFVDYRPIKAIKNYFINRYLFRNLIKGAKTETFLQSYTKLSKARAYTASTLMNSKLNYDVVIAGSDEVWNINSFRGFDPSYFINFLPNANIKDTVKISYAASFGSTKTLGIYREQVSSLLKQFNYISVRDSNSLDIVRQECHCEATKVLDPTFLADYSEITANPKSDEKYLLIYSFNLNPIEEKLIQLIAKTYGLTIISVGFYNKIATKNLVNASVNEWLGYFQNASYIVTSFYHGTIFSIIFRKPFTVLSRGDKSIKVGDLLHDLGLEKRIYISNLEEKNLSEEINQYLEIDYALVESKLSEGISNSKKFLLEAINGRY